MPPTLKKLEGHIVLSVCLSVILCVCVCVCACVCLVHVRNLKFHVCIPHEKIVDPYFFLSELCPFSELFPFEKTKFKILCARYLEKYLSYMSGILVGADE